MATRTPWRWLHRIGLLIPSGLFSLAAVLFLIPPDTLVWPSSIVGTTYRGDAKVGTVALTRRDGRWELTVKNLKKDINRSITAPFVFVGAGGAQPLAASDVAVGRRLADHRTAPES